MACPSAAERPLSGSISAMRILPEAVIGEPAFGVVVDGRRWRASLRSFGAGAQQKGDCGNREKDRFIGGWRIGAKLRQTKADGRQRATTS